MGAALMTMPSKNCYNRAVWIELVWCNGQRFGIRNQETWVQTRTEPCGSLGDLGQQPKLRCCGYTGMGGSSKEERQAKYDFLKVIMQPLLYTRVGVMCMDAFGS